MKSSLNRTMTALLARGINSETASELTKAGHTITSLKNKSPGQLHALGLTKENVTNLHVSRTSIPEKTLLKLLFNNKWVCCVCRSQNSPIVIHHIEPWKISRSHTIDNLAVLCPNDHAKIHSKGDISQNLSTDRLRILKKQWESQITKDDSKLIRQVAQVAGEYWYFFNLARLYEIAEHEGINLKNLSYYTEARRARILDSSGHLLLENIGTRYAYTGHHAALRYHYAREIFLQIIEHLSITNISDRLDRNDLGNTIISNDIIYAGGAIDFKRIDKTRSGEGQLTQGVRSANSVQIIFIFDRWYATSSSAHAMWLTGRHALGCFCRVGDISRKDGKVILHCTLLAVCTELPNQRSRSYLSNSTPIYRKVQNDDWDDFGADSIKTDFNQ